MKVINKLAAILNQNRRGTLTLTFEEFRFETQEVDADIACMLIHDRQEEESLRQCGRKDYCDLMKCEAPGNRWQYKKIKDCRCSHCPRSWSLKYWAERCITARFLILENLRTRSL
jgi:hypothetical protein